MTVSRPTMVERIVRAHKDAADADARPEERALELLLTAHKHHGKGTNAATVLLSPADFRRALRLSRTVDESRGLGRHATLVRLTEKVTGRRVE